MVGSDVESIQCTVPTDPRFVPTAAALKKVTLAIPAGAHSPRDRFGDGLRTVRNNVGVQLIGAIDLISERALGEVHSVLKEFGIIGGLCCKRHLRLELRLSNRGMAGDTGLGSRIVASRSGALGRPPARSFYAFWCAVLVCDCSRILAKRRNRQQYGSCNQSNLKACTGFGHGNYSIMPVSGAQRLGKACATRIQRAGMPVEHEGYCA